MRYQLIAVILFLVPFLPLRADEGAVTPPKGGRGVCIRDIYAAAPDSIFPLLTKNNRLDQIDFRENNMKADVKNKFDAHAELLVLTDRYLRLQLSKHCLVEMRLLSDSTICMVQTYNAPAPDSRIRFFNAAWQEQPSVIEQPSVSDFLSDDIDTDTRLALEALPLIKASLSEEDNTITFELQTSELTKEQRKQVEGKIHEITKEL
ncbi:MAG: DUF3256 family protein [Bacteroidaceae bacterium]|nr:DUF3256 family protein [Bacteroidaceae bacterium]MBQ9293599.1 DUF3256 family protein [Bacteroidaceae bacterium]